MSYPLGWPLFSCHSSIPQWPQLPNLTRSLHLERVEVVQVAHPNVGKEPYDRLDVVVLARPVQRRHALVVHELLHVVLPLEDAQLSLRAERLKAAVRVKR